MYGNYAPFYRSGYFNPMQTPNMAESQNQFTQPFQAPMQPTQMSAPMPQTTNDMIFVLNENEASSYPVAPNNRVVLWDKNQTTFYVKSANAQGIPSMQVFDFTERAQNAPQTPTEHVCKCGDNYVTKDDFNALKGEFEDLSKRFEETAVTQVTKAPKTTKKGDDR